jgi:uncharacterized damage-inducible protein DinB
MNRSQLLFQLKAVSQSVVSLFRRCPAHRLEYRPAPGVRTLQELGDHFAAMPLVDLAILQGNPRQVAEAIEESLHGTGPEEWVEIFERGVRAAGEYFEGLPEEEFETKETRAYYGTAHPQNVWLFELIAHIYHHRGQLYAYLRMAGAAVDVEHLYT